MARITYATLRSGCIESDDGRMTCLRLSDASKVAWPSVTKMEQSLSVAERRNSQIRWRIESELMGSSTKSNAK